MLNNKNIVNNIFRVVEPSFEEWANVGKAVFSVSALGWVKRDRFENILSRKDDDPISTFSLDYICSFVNLMQICRELGHYKM